MFYIHVIAGVYMYTEVTFREFGATARLISPIFYRMVSIWHCLTFSYNMFGPDMGTLRVANVQGETIWSQTGG